jgi:Fic family protein
VAGFFLEGMEITARSAADAAKQILTLFAKDRDRIQTIGRAASSALRVHECLQKKPLVAIGTVAEELKLSIPTVTGALDHLVRLGIAKEVTGKRRARLFGYSRYLKILSEGTEPLKR